MWCRLRNRNFKKVSLLYHSGWHEILPLLRQEYISHPAFLWDYESSVGVPCYLPLEVFNIFSETCFISNNLYPQMPECNKKCSLTFGFHKWKKKFYLFSVFTYVLKNCGVTQSFQNSRNRSILLLKTLKITSISC